MAEQDQTLPPLTGPDGRIQGSSSPTTSDEEEGALKTSDAMKGDTEVKGRGEKVFSPEREAGVRVNPPDLQTHQKEGDEESGKAQTDEEESPSTPENKEEKELIDSPTSDRTARPQDSSETEETDGQIAQTDGEESPSTPENKEEEELIDSADKQDENKTIPENIGAGDLDRAQTDEEESPSTPENKEEKELIDSPNKRDENKTTPENIGDGDLDRGEGRGKGKDFVREGEEDDETTETDKRDEKTGKGTWLMAGAVAAVILAVLVYCVQSSESPPEQKEVPRIVIFLRELETVKTQFPSQRPELWRRGRIHLERHLQTARPTEPVSLILTAGRRAERTLHCLARRLASSFSTALNASVLYIDGASKARQDSDQVKLDIDSKLQNAFEGDKPVAVIHRFEELPPGSTLIFYRYCDHENAAYKKTALIFTVLLGGEEELPAQLGLSVVEEMVDDHLQRKFLSSDHPTSFDRMDIDKYSGLWSRISHLILPVAAEQKIERHGC